MHESAVRTVGLAASVCYAALIVWAYVHQPQSFVEVAGGLSANIGAYQIDQQAFDEGLRANVIAGQRRRLADFGDARVMRELAALLHTLS